MCLILNGEQYIVQYSELFDVLITHTVKRDAEILATI